MTPKFVGPTATRDSGTCDHLASPEEKRTQTVVMFKEVPPPHSFLGSEEMGKTA